ncbi:MAG: hydroxymethylbilane synthase [Ktedonobacteraceae bacterium]
MVQTMQVIKKLQQQWPGLEITIEQIRTTGDRVIDKPLSQIGGDGVFVTEIEHALHEKRIDIAVHSLKDLPTMQPADLRLVIVGPREDVRDVFVSNEPGIQLGANMRVGTCSLRRMAQIRALYPAVQILPIRGNVDTRLRKLDAGEYDCILLAAAGLHRLDMQERLAGRITYLPIEAVMPAPGQGALALEIRDEPALYDELLAPLNDPAVQVATAAERMFMRHLGAGCYLPVAAYGRLHAQELTLHGLVISLDGQDLVRVQQSVAWTTASTLEHAEQLGIAVAEQALAQGAMEIIGVLNANREQEQQYA